MAYTSDPMQVALAKFFETDGQSFFYSPPNSDASLPITPEEYFDAQDRFVLYSKIARILSIAMSFGAFAWVTWWMFDDTPLLFLSIIGFILSLILGALGYFITGRLVLSPFERRLRIHVREQLGWKRQGWRRAARSLGIAPRTLAIVGVITLGFTAMGARDLHRRHVILNHGIVTAATVTRTDAAKKCRIDYRYTSGSDGYQGHFGDCRVMNTHPVGSTIDVRVVASDPGYAIPDGEGLWSPDLVGLFMILGCEAMAALGTFAVSRSYAPPDEADDWNN